MSNQTIVIIGAGTGGLQVLPGILAGLGDLDSGVLVVQHMPRSINEAIRQRLGKATTMPVKIAQDGDTLEKGAVYLAPGDVHLTLSGNQMVVLAEGEKVNHVRPSIDATMKSLEDISDFGIIGVLLTGMGHDGAQGMQHIKLLGGCTIVQDEASCVVSEMPKSAVEIGCVDFSLSAEDIPKKIRQLSADVASSP